MRLLKGSEKNSFSHNFVTRGQKSGKIVIFFLNRNLLTKLAVITTPTISFLGGSD